MSDVIVPSVCLRCGATLGDPDDCFLVASAQVTSTSRYGTYPKMGQRRIVFARGKDKVKGCICTECWDKLGLALYPTKFKSTNSPNSTKS